MSTRSIIKKTAETLMYGRFPYGLMKHVPQGFEFYFDLKKYKKHYQPNVVFDVGANTGQTVLKWNKFFPKAEYHCFEPVAGTMSVLRTNTHKLKNIHYYQCALGAERIQSEIVLCEDSSLNSLVDTTRSFAEETELVQVNTLDQVCHAENVNSIDILKIDTEGFDIEVLKGATSMLEANKIEFIQVEAGMNPTNKLHVPLQSFLDFLVPFGYVLFGIYEQHLEWTGENRLAFSNPVFISERYSSGK
ncbi:MAG: FkbM family methyltransferase [Flavisolibacter sp.]